jgi:hypothetical protein
VWLHQVSRDGSREALAGITTATSLRVPAPPARRSNAYTWSVRPLDSLGTAGPKVNFQAGPTPDTRAPARPAAPTVTSRGRTQLIVRIPQLRDAGSGVESWEIERRIVGSTGRAVVASGLASQRATPVRDLLPGRIIELRVRAIDRAGNVGPFSAVRRVRTA